MAISDIFKSIICCSCGLCCSKQVLCSNCELSTLRANGLKIELQSQISGLLKGRNGNPSKFQYSDLYYKIQELSK